MTVTDIEALARALKDLPPEKRLARYRELAAEALSQAESCDDETARRATFRIATAWNALAADLERNIANKRA